MAPRVFSGTPLTRDREVEVLGGIDFPAGSAAGLHPPRVVMVMFPVSGHVCCPWNARPCPRHREGPGSTDTWSDVWLQWVRQEDPKECFS